MKTIKVVAAVLLKENQVLIARRLKGEFKDMWEFPGGKVEPGETNQEAIKREIQEEFEVDIDVHEHLITAHYDYETFHLEMDCFICDLCSEDIHLNDHSAIKWIHYNDQNIDWVPADVQVIEALRSKQLCKKN